MIKTKPILRFLFYHHVRDCCQDTTSEFHGARED